MMKVSLGLWTIEESGSNGNHSFFSDTYLQSMTGKLLLDWSILAVSLFNTILLLWLGLTVLLNAEQRTWGVWLTGGGLLVGSAFFISHTAILGRGLSTVGRGMDFWWHVGWGPVIASPFAWYAVILWYAGFWDDRDSTLRRRQRFWFVLTVLLAIGLVGLLLFANPFPSYWQVTQLDLSATPSVGSVPLLILIYPLYILLCISLSLDALRRPGPSGRAMGDLARRRARPWLVAASVALLLVSLLVAWAMLWIVLNARQRALYGIYNEMALTLGWFDLIIAALIGIAILLQGQAIVAYEVFTGKTLPRRGFWRHWRSAIVLSAGYSTLVGGGLVFRLHSIYGLLLSTLLMALFYALFSWRSYAERERAIAHLRPFVASQRVYEHLSNPSSPPEVDLVTPFRALCEDVLGAQVAYLIALGPLAPLVGPALVYPSTGSARIPSLVEIINHFSSPQTMCLPLDPARYAGARWAVPLWSERGLIGALLLGEKRDGSLYAQEEIEIARASGERLIDTQAGAEMARRLMALQRQRLVESQLLDRQARRVLHDDVLPQLHSTILALSSKEADRDDVISLLGDIHRQLSDLLREMPAATAPEVGRLGLFGALRQVVDEELEGTFDSVSWQVEPEGIALPALTAEVLFYAAREAIRNAARYGRGGNPDRSLHLRVEATWHDLLADSLLPGASAPTGQRALAGQRALEIVIEDDGVGLSGAEGTNGGGGQGLALHSTMMAVVGGSLAVEGVPDTYTRVSLTLPIL
jgi:signal transduction histidine kinase